MIKALTAGIAPKLPKHGDTSSAYWKLYRSEAEINDKNLVETLTSNTDSMGFLVRGDPHHVHIVVSYDYLTVYFVFFHRRIIYHRNIQDPPDSRSAKYRPSHQYRAVSQLLPQHHERGVLCSYPAMVF